MKILNLFKSLRSFFNRDNLDNIAETLAITNFSINKGSYFTLGSNAHRVSEVGNVIGKK